MCACVCLSVCKASWVICFLFLFLVFSLAPTRYAHKHSLTHPTITSAAAAAAAAAAVVVVLQLYRTTKAFLDSKTKVLQQKNDHIKQLQEKIAGLEEQDDKRGQILESLLERTSTLQVRSDR